MDVDERYETFWRELAAYYAGNGRHDMPWRQPEPDGHHDPYKILVSELMLQQTQVTRVLPKYADFLMQYPTAAALAAAPLADVLRAWAGLGYNRRAKYLWQAAQAVVQSSGGVFPRSLTGLQQLPGVGPNTAGAILAYAYNLPVIYVETNIRTVIIHHFFADASGVPDRGIRDVLETATNTSGAAGRDDILEPREFYWAMMDYGAFLKRTVGNLNRASSSYARQSKFQGSQRQLRGAAIRLLAAREYAYTELLTELGDTRAASVIDQLAAEELIRRSDGTVRLA